MNEPTEYEAIRRLLVELRCDMHTGMPAKVLAYDAARQTVDVRPALLREVPTSDPRQPWEFEKLPDLYAVPIKWPRAGGFIITFPISVGDWVKVDFAEQSTMNWRSKGDAPSHPGINDPHGLNGAVAEVGWYPDREKATNVSTTKLVIGKPDGTSIISVGSDGSVLIGSGAPGTEKGIPDATLVAAHLQTLATAINALGGALPVVFPPVSPPLALGKAKGF